jgi:phage terminase large subunit-like protein
LKRRPTVHAHWRTMSPSLIRFVIATWRGGRTCLDLAIREIGYDRTFAGEIVTNLREHSLELVQFGQGFLSLAAPTAELERLVVSRALWHSGHPVLRWNASNVAVRQDPAGNIKPDKSGSGLTGYRHW